jgi:Ni/Co efflux regulator RcnB
MQQIKHGVILIGAILLGSFAYAQDSQSLGDVARQVRQQKQDKDAKSKAAQDAKARKVITNEQMPEPSDLAAQTSGVSDEHGNATASSSNGMKMSAEQWKSQIQAQENLVHTQEAELNKLNDSIHFAPGNCVSGCVQWNERQKEKQEQAERMAAQLEEQKKRLEEMQESARQQGYGSSVYEP